MAEITREYLNNSIDGMRRQIAAYNGAIEYAEHLLGILDTDVNVSVQELAEAIAGPGATVEVMEMEKQNAAV